MQAVLGRRHATWIILLSFVVAGFLTMVPLPDGVDAWRPEWVAVVLIYWVMALPHRVGLFTAWVLGFFVDVLEGTILGLNALTLALVAYMTLSLYQRLRMFTLVQQSFTVLILVGIHQLLSFWILTVSNETTAPNLMFMMAALSSAVIWPLAFVLLRKLRRGFRVR